MLVTNMYAGVQQVLLIMLKKARARVLRARLVDGRAGRAQRRRVSGDGTVNFMTLRARGPISVMSANLSTGGQQHEKFRSISGIASASKQH